MQESFMDSFTNDNNMIIEEADFYQKLPPTMQTEMIEYLFSWYMKKFAHIFAFTEKGFRNELIIQMYSRRFYPN